MTTFSDELFLSVQEIWKKTHQHPFIPGLGRGDLPVTCFQRYMKQDYVYLIHYSKLFALGVLKARDVSTMATFAEILNGTLHGEMNLHRNYARKLGISEKELEETTPTPINLAYTTYMLHVAQTESLEALLAALLPCMWSYCDIASCLTATYPEAMNHHLYGDWVSMYASEDFQKHTEWFIRLLDMLTEHKSPQEREMLQTHFVTSAKYEYMFWDMVYEGGDWPV